jgi:membrane-associated protein
MELLKDILDFILHIDVHLNDLILAYGLWTYAILILIIFCETGLVVTPFLPDDSLLFAAGALSASGSMDPVWLFVLLSVAAIVGNIVNYSVGRYLGPRILRDGKMKFLNKAHLERAHKFYAEHGGKTIVIARFLPILRTFAPFVAGVGFMTYTRFMVYNVAAGIAWVGIFIFGGYYFGNLPAVKNNFTIVVGAIIIISMIPPVIEFFRQRARSTEKT